MDVHQIYQMRQPYYRVHQLHSDGHHLDDPEDHPEHQLHHQVRHLAHQFEVRNRYLRDRHLDLQYAGHQNLGDHRRDDLVHPYAGHQNLGDLPQDDLVHLDVRRQGVALQLLRHLAEGLHPHLLRTGCCQGARHEVPK
jgi:hypothetical protein